MKTYFKFSLTLLLIISVMFACKSDKKTADSKKATPSASVASNTGESYQIDNNASQVIWTGSKPTGTHTGTIALQSGSLIIDGKNITGGSFVLDMNSITNTDMEGDEKTNLEGHLKGATEENQDHFFNVAKYPTASFKITKVEGVKSDGATHSITGDLTIKGITESINFLATVIAANNEVTATATKLTFDRTKFGVNYKSKNVFKNLGDKFVNDEIVLNVSLKAVK